MKIYLIRHGIAEDAVDASLQGRSDASRALTKEGKDKTNLVAKRFSLMSGAPEVILHSPFLRAKETAQIFHQYFSEALLQEVESLRPSDEPSEGVELIDSFSAKVRRIMLVSHEPYLSYLASLLITGSLKHPIPFKKAGIACIEWRGAGASILHYHVPPKVFLQ